MIKNKQLQKIFLVACLGILHITPLFANNSSVPDSKAPMNIESNYVEFDDQKGIAFYEGNVVSTQGSRRMYSDTLTIYRGNDNKINLMVATGKPAHFQAQPNSDKSIGYGRANTIEYYPNDDKAILLEEAELEQDGDTIKGKRLTYFFDKSLLISTPQQNSRTTVIIQPRGSLNE